MVAVAGCPRRRNPSPVGCNGTAAISTVLRRDLHPLARRALAMGAPPWTVWVVVGGARHLVLLSATRVSVSRIRTAPGHCGAGCHAAGDRAGSGPRAQPATTPAPLKPARATSNSSGTADAQPRAITPISRRAPVAGARCLPTPGVYPNGFSCTFRRQAAGLLFAMGAIALLAGCASHPRGHVAVMPTPGVPLGVAPGRPVLPWYAQRSIGRPNNDAAVGRGSGGRLLDAAVGSAMSSRRHDNTAAGAATGWSWAQPLVLANRSKAATARKGATTLPTNNAWCPEQPVVACLLPAAVARGGAAGGTCARRAHTRCTGRRAAAAAWYATTPPPQ